jgi:hypothetical protein
MQSRVQMMKRRIKMNKDPSTLIGQFAGFIDANKNILAKDVHVILNVFSTALTISNVHDFCVIDSMVSLITKPTNKYNQPTNITNKYNHPLDFKKNSPPSQIFIANGKSAPIFKQGKIKLLFQTITSLALYVPSFPFKLLFVVLNELGFIRSNADHSVFIRIKSDERLVVLIDVDDLIFTSNNHAAITNCKSILHQQFVIKDLGVLKYFLSI